MLMEELRQDGFDFDGLKQEIDSAFQRRKRDEGTLVLCLRLFIHSESRHVRFRGS